MSHALESRLASCLTGLPPICDGYWARGPDQRDWLLRARRQRPRSRRAANERDELAPLHSITSSARATKIGGTSRPRAFAVLRLMTRENLLGRSIGNSLALAPLRMRSM